MYSIVLSNETLHRYCYHQGTTSDLHKHKLIEKTSSDWPKMHFYLHNVVLKVVQLWVRKSYTFFIFLPSSILFFLKYPLTDLLVLCGKQTFVFWFFGFFLPFHKKKNEKVPSFLFFCEIIQNCRAIINNTLVFKP